MKKDKENQRRGGFYWINKEPYVSVTNVLQVLDKSGALMYWFGKQVYLAVIKDPSISEKEALTAPYDKSRSAKSRGATVHSLIEAQKNGNQVLLETIPEEFRGYVKAFYLWMDEHKPEIIENEKIVFSSIHKFAGTLDLICKIGDKTYIVDFKTSKDGNLYPEVELQLAGYKMAIEEQGIKIDGCMAVGLSEKGTSTTKIVKPAPEEFLALLKLWIWKNKDDCKTVGYIGGTNARF